MEGLTGLVKNRKLVINKSELSGTAKTFMNGHGFSDSVFITVYAGGGDNATLNVEMEAPFISAIKQHIRSFGDEVMLNSKRPIALFKVHKESGRIKKYNFATNSFKFIRSINTWQELDDGLKVKAPVGENTVEGDIANAPKHTAYITHDRPNTVKGDLKDAPKTSEYVFNPDTVGKGVEIDLPMNDSFRAAIVFLNSGEMLRRSNWADGCFIFMQVPSEVPIDVVRKMSSLPRKVKEKFMLRYLEANKLFGNSKHFKSIRYKDQIAFVNENNEIVNWSPSVSDLYAEDWELVT